MDAGLIWILAGLLLLVTELVLPGVFLLWVGLAAIGTGLVVQLVAPAFWVVVVVFLAMLAGSIGAALRLRRGAGPAAHGLNTPQAGLVGRNGVLLPPEGAGHRVRVGDSDWPARLTHHAVAQVGDAVRVEAVDGTTLVVRPAD